MLTSLNTCLQKGANLSELISFVKAQNWENKSFYSTQTTTSDPYGLSPAEIADWIFCDTVLNADTVEYRKEIKMTYKSRIWIQVSIKTDW